MKDENVRDGERFHPSSFRLHPSAAERSHSGLVHRSRKPEWVYAHRGFESHPLRHDIFDCRLPIADFRLAQKPKLKFQSAIGNRKSKILRERCKSG
jgi:hypothetical protein